MTVFECDDYKDWLRFQIAQNRGEKAYKGKLAQAAGCHKTFLSQVLNSHIHLTPDHATGLTDFWQFSEEETSFFLCLVMLARSGSRRLKQFLERQMEKARTSRQKPSDRFQWNEVPRTPKGAEIYYSSWYWAAIHVLISCEAYQSPEQIARRLGLPQTLVVQAINILETAGIIKRSKGRWMMTEKKIFLTDSSPLIEMHHFNWRQKGMANLQAQDRTALHYSSVFTLSEGDFGKLKEEITCFLETLNQRIEPSPAEDIFSFNCDFFRL